MTTTTTPKFAARITRRSADAPDWHSPISITVFDPERRVDRHEHVTGWGVGERHGKLAERLKRAIEAGAALSNPEIKTDINGKTYWSTTSNVMGWRMNADLKRLGF